MTTPDTADARKKLAEAELAEANAEKARQDARSAQTKADKDQREEHEASSGLAASLIPDLSKLDTGKTEAKGDTTLLGGAVSYYALKAAARRAAEEVKVALPDQARVLVTTKEDLASSDDAYCAVTSQLASLTKAAATVTALAAHPDPTRSTDGAGVPPTVPDRSLVAAGVAVTAVAKAASAAIPSLLKLTTANRTITGQSVAADDLAAAAAVVGYFAHRADRQLVLDDFRPLPRTALLDNVDALRSGRTALANLREPWAQDLSEATRVRAAAEDQLKLSNAQILAALTAKQDPAALVSERETHARERDERAAAESVAAAHIGQIDAVAAAIDAFLTYLDAVPSGQQRSTLGSAALRAQLHTGPRPFTHVLLVKAQAGTINQLINDRPFFFADTFSSTAAMSITYLLIDLDGSILRSNVIPGVATLTGKVGDAITTSAIAVVVPEPDAEL
jgi:hypothetical protein